MTDTTRLATSPQIIVVQRSPSMVAAILGLVFAVLGLFLFALLFVPLAVICGVVGLISGIRKRSTGGIVMSVVALLIVTVDIMTSPTILALFGLGLLAKGH